MDLTAPSDAARRVRPGRWRRILRLQLPWIVGLVVVLLLAWGEPTGLKRLDLLAYDLLLPMRQAGQQPAVLVAIDDESLATLGRWPWPRNVHARMVDRLREAGASVIGLTLLLPEPDPYGDTALALAIARHGRVVLPLVPVRQPDGSITEGEPTPALRSRVARLGHADAEIDVDGQVRRIYLHAGAGGAVHPAIVLAMHELLATPSPYAALPGLRRAKDVAATPRSWVRDQEVLLPRAPAQPTVSFARALQLPELLSDLRGRVVFVGITAPGLGGELATPISGNQALMPAVAFHANIFDALRSHTLIEPATSGLQLGFALLVVSVLTLTLPHASRHHLWWAGATVCLPTLASAGILHATQVWLAPFTATLALMAASAAWLGLHLRNDRRQLARARQHSLATLEAIGDGVVTVDARLTVRYANPVAQLQANGTNPIGSPLPAAIPMAAADMLLLSAAANECMCNAVTVRLATNLSLLSPLGPVRSMRVSVSPLNGPGDQLDGAVIVLSDVTDAVANANRLRHAATHDALTDLPNRILLHDRMRLALARVQRLDSSMAVLFLDLDRFKRINDSLGHSQGDEVQKVMAERLRSICRSTDFVARWGGDEFVVLMEDVSGAEAVAVAAAKLVAALGEDIDANGMRLPSACSVGIVMAPQDGVDIDVLMAKADTAMYRAKSHPDTGFHFFSSELKIWTRERLAIEVDLRHGLREARFELHYQPQYDLRGGALVGFEALLRWRRTPDSLVQPDQFIGVAEETGLIVEIGAWVVMQAAKDVAAWLAAGRPPLPVAVNVSARQCVNRNIVEVVRAALRETGIPAALLKLEITETTAMTDAAQVVELLEEIRGLGVRIAVDDFGTGYSSLAYLKRFPIDELKIDRSFVRDVATDPDDAAIVRATIALAHELGILVVAEGVETEQQNTFLSQQNCDIVQGYLYGRPQPHLRDAQSPRQRSA